MFLAAGLVASGLGVFVTSGTGRWIANTAIGLASVIALLIGVRMNRPARPAGWLLLATGLAGWVVADFLWSYYELVAHTSPLASPADALYLGGYALVALGIAWMIRARSPEGDREGLLDAIVAAVAGMIVVWQLVIGPTIIPTSDPLAFKVLYAFYPLSDVLLLAVLVRLAFVRGSRSPSFWMLAIGLAVTLVGDIAWTAMSQAGLYDALWIDALYQAAYVLLAAAALHPTMREMAEPGAGRQSPLTVSRTVFLALALLVPVGATLWADIGLSLRVAVVVPAIGMLIFAVIARVLYASRERERALQRVRSSETRFRTVFQGAGIGIATVDARAHIVQVNEAAARLFAYPEAELIGMPLANLLEADDGGFLEQFGELVLGDIRRYEREQRFRRKDGESIWGQVAISLVPDAEDALGFAILMVQDITDRKRFEAELAHRTLNDELTGLPNRNVFLDRVTVALARTRRSGMKLAVLFLDLDRFKEINDGMGHEAGDQLLVELGQRLAGTMRSSDTVARFGGDEFAILHEDLRGEGDAENLAARVLAVIEEPTTIQGREIFTTASLGVVVVSDPDVQPQDLLRDADTAMYQAKRRGGARFERFETAMTDEAESRLELGGRLRTALRDGEFELFYQPIVTTGTGRLAHVEALIRWRHPDRGLVPPIEFIPIAVESGFIVPLGAWVLDEAVRQLDRWDRTRGNGASIGVSVNVSARQFMDFDLPGAVDKLIDDTRISPERLCLEITEDVLLDDVDQVTDVLQTLDGFGVQIAVDDFGTGYSSLGYLRRLPADFLKIDRSFISRLDAEDRGDHELVSAIVAMGHALGMQIVAEGVETAAQLDQLAELECDLVQGYLLGKPGPALEVDPLFEQDLRPEGNGSGNGRAPQMAARRP